MRHLSVSRYRRIGTQTCQSGAVQSLESSISPCQSLVNDLIKSINILTVRLSWRLLVTVVSALVLCRSFVAFSMGEMNMFVWRSIRMCFPSAG